MRVLVTGATGFIGLNIVQQLQDAGHEVLALLRPRANRRFLAAFQVEERYAAFGDEDALLKAMHKVDAVIHTAGATSCRWQDIEQLTDANVISTRNLLRAALKKGVQRMVYTSSTSTIGSHHPELIAADAWTPLQGFRAKSPYAITKLQAEKILLEASQRIDSIILNPAEVIGAWDHNLQWGRIILALAAGRLPFVPPGTCTFSPAREVAKAHVVALQKGRPGQRYVLGGQHLPIKRFIEIGADLLQVPAQANSHRPYFVHQWQSHVLSHLSQYFKVQAAIDPYRMRVFAGHHLFDDSAARHDLHYQPSSIQSAIAECIAWYRDYGFLEDAHYSSTTQERVSI